MCLLKRWTTIEETLLKPLPYRRRQDHHLFSVVVAAVTKELHFAQLMHACSILRNSSTLEITTVLKIGTDRPVEPVQLGTGNANGSVLYSKPLITESEANR
ncbi:uncharacterized protein LOC110264284 [Arachis ipaensis]|uniref:uncharacterized protein LOC110264284 n=1 Tax=Arachis ipaensis TaxID=130454 RepID=UPI000A2B4FC8|nr:uncharacterized protein LOC110264284 [Arachis ipaensis]